MQKAWNDYPPDEQALWLKWVKALAMTSSSNEHERDNGLIMAQAIMKRIGPDTKWGDIPNYIRYNMNDLDLPRIINGRYLYDYFRPASHTRSMADDLVTALESVGGEATLPILYGALRKFRRCSAGFESSVRNTLQRHWPESRHYIGYDPRFIKDGRKWKLIVHQEQSAA